MVFRFYKVARACARPENRKQTQVRHPLLLLNSNVGWWFGLSQNYTTHSHFRISSIFALFLEETVFPFGARRDLCSKGVNMLRCEGPACVSRVWLMRLIVKGRLWFRKRCHYSVCFNIPHGFGVWFLFNTEQWLLFFHASLTITAVSKQTEAGPETLTQCYCSATVEVKLNIVIVWCHLS